MPAEVQSEMGFALFLAQSGMKHSSAKPLSGFGGAGVLEIVSNHDGDTFRCGLCASRVPEEIEAWDRDTEGRAERDRDSSEVDGAHGEGRET